MKKLLYPFLALALAFSAFIAIGFTAVEAITYDDSFYAGMFERLDTAERIGISQAVLSEFVEETQDLLMGEAYSYSMSLEKNGVTVEAFGTQENVHMLEVAGLFGDFAEARAACVVICLAIGIVAAINLRGRVGVFFLSAIGLTAACLALIGLWAFISFDSFFTVFHLILFDNDDWMFPASSLLIQILDIDFFSAFAMRVIALLGLAYGLLAALSLVSLPLAKKWGEMHAADPDFSH